MPVSYRTLVVRTLKTPMKLGLLLISYLNAKKLMCKIQGDIANYLWQCSVDIRMPGPHLHPMMEILASMGHP